MRWQVAAVLPLSALICLSDATSAPAPQGHLTFAQRVDAQEAIERVYHAHQVGASLPFEQAVPRALIEEKVRTSLKRSAALERFWGKRITGAMLAAEAERMARGSRMPDRLRELHAALGDDPLLILECLVRPALVDRMVHEAFESARPPHAPPEFDDWWREAAAGLDERLVSVAEDLPASLPRPEPVTTPGAAMDSTAGGGPASLYPGCVPTDAWVPSSLDNPPQARSGHTAVWTGTVMIVWGGNSGVAPLRDGFRYDPATDAYTPLSTTNAPSARSGHTAVMANGRMIVWGGRDSSVNPYLGTGAIYRPLTDTWVAISPLNAPAPREGHTAVWTGSEMIIWGGSSPAPLNTGARFAMATDSWSAITPTGAPSARTNHTAIWTGIEMIVWGGEGTAGVLDDGASYAPSATTWMPLPSSGAPTARTGHSAIWTGFQMIVWGGVTNLGLINTGAAYSPMAGVWTPMSTVDAPYPRSDHTAVWDGMAMHVWGGGDVNLHVWFDTGGSYDPAADSWVAMSTTDAPTARTGHTAVWTGAQMVIWGGKGPQSTEVGAGGRFDPSSNTWTPPVESMPPSRWDAVTVWTGNEMIVWGGINWGFSFVRSGGRYNPATDTWTIISTAGSPTGSAEGVWTGSEMILGNGRYNPVADTWSPVSSINAAPLGPAVWTGGLVVFWNGFGGGRYYPATDTWRSVSTVGAPPSVSFASVVWTGSRMISWGGTLPGGPFNHASTGGIYDPLTDTWQPTSIQGAPLGRYRHTAIWTGQKMFIWGGAINTGDGPNGLYSGGLYDPATDTWQPATPGGPTGGAYGFDNAAVWTGSRVIVWGGRANDLAGFNGSPWAYQYSSTGSLYDPVTDTWAPVTTSAAPGPRAAPAAVWTGSSMLVWGGLNCNSNTQTCRVLSTGGVYGFDPSADGDGDGFGSNCDCDDATATVHPGAPQICDGMNNDCLDPSWPSLIGTNEIDEDGDGVTECAGDCDDTRDEVLPGGAQVCDALNNDCDDPQWPALPAGDVDDDGDGVPVCPVGPADCDDGNAAVWGPPTEASVNFGAGPFPTYVAWDRPADPGGVVVRYDLLRSSSGSDFVNATVCFATDVLWQSTSGGDPAGPNEIYYFLVRSENDCPGANQSSGYRSDGTPRVGRSCP